MAGGRESFFFFEEDFDFLFWRVFFFRGNDDEIEREREKPWGLWLLAPKEEGGAGGGGG